jgi:hypothetical protein
MVSNVGKAERLLDLPPAYTLISLREHADAFAHGVRIAAESGAGTLIRVGRYDVIELAVVLEPAESLASARGAFFCGMNAAAHALAAGCPPEREISFAWPDAIFVDGGLVGGIRLGWPAGCAEEAVPAWLVLGLMLRVAEMTPTGIKQVSPGMSLVGAGFELIDTDAIIRGFARHLMKGVDQWNEFGFDPTGEAYLKWLRPLGSESGRRLDGNGDLLVENSGSRMRLSLLEALKRSSWFDVVNNSPRFG